MKKYFSVFFVFIFVMCGLVLSHNAMAVVPPVVTIFSDGFGSGSTDTTFDESPVWLQSGAGTEKKTSASGDDTVSPNGARFVLVAGKDGWICRTIDAVGYDNLYISYYWRGDTQSKSSSDKGLVEYKTSGNCSDTDDTWTNLATHDLQVYNSWTTVSPYVLPIKLNNSSFLLRFHAQISSSSTDYRVDGISITGNAIPIVDTDADGIQNGSDNCPNVANANQADADGDGVGDTCDNSPANANPDQADDDNDHIGNVSDNCPNIANASQTDADVDGIGDVCDDTPNGNITEFIDSDNDGIADGVDNCPLTQNGPNQENNNQLDDDYDGIGNSCDQYYCIYSGPEFGGDGIDNNCDGYTDEVATIDICPNVEGMQISGTCVDSFCLAPNTWNIQTQNCDEPVVVNPPEEEIDICPNVDDMQTEGTCLDALCLTPNTWNKQTQTCDAPAPEVVVTEVQETQGSKSSGYFPQITKPAGNVGKVLGVEKFIFTKLLKVWTYDDEVTELQKFLTNAGYDCGPIDGKYGPLTKAGVIKFQIANGLKGDGIVGLITRELLNK